MIVPDWLCWLAYIGVSLVAGLVVLVTRLRPPPIGVPARLLIRCRRAVGVASSVCALINVLVLLTMVAELSPFGVLLFLAIVTSQLGLGLALAFGADPRPARGARGLRAWLRRGLARIEAPFAAVAVATAILMLLVRAQVLWIFG